VREQEEWREKGGGGEFGLNDFIVQKVHLLRSP
jgi:hypothetical protein